LVLFSPADRIKSNRLLANSVGRTKHTVDIDSVVSYAAITLEGLEADVSGRRTLAPLERAAFWCRQSDLSPLAADLSRLLPHYVE